MSDDLIEGEAIELVDEATPPPDLAKRGITQLSDLTDEEQARVAIRALNYDYSGLTVREKLGIYLKRCEVAGVNPLLRPFQWGTIDGKTQLVRTKALGAQVRQREAVSVRVVEQVFDVDRGVYAVRVVGETPDGRVDEDLGAESIIGMRGQDLADAMMKAFTKAKSRVTESMFSSGGGSDQTEVRRQEGGIRTIDPQVSRMVLPPPMVPGNGGEGRVAGVPGGGPPPPPRAIGAKPAGGSPPAAAEKAPEAAQEVQAGPPPAPRPMPPPPSSGAPKPPAPRRPA